MTAVEWLEKQLLKNGYVNKGYHTQDSLNHLENLFVQAKEMHEKEIIDAHIDGQPIYSCQSEKAKEYYNEQFKKK